MKDSMPTHARILFVPVLNAGVKITVEP